jgi:hypothetical protein
VTTIGTFRIEAFMTREMQFCSVCYSQGKGWVRCANVGDCVELRRKHGQVKGMRVYRARRRRSFRQHFAAEHPEIKLRDSR